MYEGTTSRTSTGLIRRAKANDRDAWQQLVETYSRSVYRWCRRAGLQSADASNVVQEVLRAVARKLADFQHDQQGATFRGWIRRITQNKIRDHFRQQMRVVAQGDGGTDSQRRLQVFADPFSYEDEFTHPHQPNATSGAVDPRIIDQVRAEFSDRDWRFFWRVVVDGQSAVEVAEEFGVTANTVRLVKMRLLRRFRQLASG